MTHFYRKLLVLMLFFALSLPGHAQLPEVRIQNNLSYIMGGIGEDEAKAIQAESKSWSLSIEFSEYLDNRDSWASGVQLKIINSKGEAIFDELINGPMLLVNLSAGNYQLIGTYSGVSKKISAQIATGKSLRVSMNWRLAKGDKAPSNGKTSNVAEFDKRTTQIQENFKIMQEQMNQIRATTDPQERQRLLKEHWNAMQGNANLMQEVWGTRFMECCARNGNMMGGGNMMGWGDNPHYPNLTPEQLRQHQHMMDRYIGMQQNMMNQMMMQQNYMWMHQSQ